MTAPAPARPNELTGLDALRWLADKGARFVKVTRWNSTGKNPGKMPFEEEWQNRPYILTEIQPHIKSGGNVGQICGKHSNGLCLLDADWNYSGFCETFPNLATAPTIVRDGADKGKILIRIGGEIPDGNKWLRPGEKHPFFEFLSTGSQGVIPPSRHPEGSYYRLINVDKPIPELTPEMLNDVCEVWTGSGLDFPEAPEISYQEKAARHRSTNQNGDGLRDRVLEYWGPLKVFKHHGLADQIVEEKPGELRLKGNGGLLVRPEIGDWSIPGNGKGYGGGGFEAWWHCKHGNVNVPGDHQFYELLCEMAQEAGIDTHPNEKQAVKVYDPPPPDIPDDYRIPEPAHPEPPLEPDEEESPGRFALFDAVEALGPEEPINWFLEGLIAFGSLATVAGAGGTGKTYALLDLAVSNIADPHWLGFPIAKTKVLVVDEESGKQRLKRRLGRIIRGHFAENIIQPGDINCVSLSLLNLREGKEAALLQALIEYVGAKLIIIDALIDVAGGADENKSQEMHAVFQRLRKIADDTGAVIFVIHHTSKAGDVRGSTAIKGACDLVIVVEKKDGSPNMDFETVKARDIEPTKFAAVLNFNDVGQTWLTSSSPKQRDQALSRPQRWIINYLKDHGPSTRAALTTDPDMCSSRAASDAIYQLVEKKLIYRTNPEIKTGKGIEAIYALKEPEEEGQNEN